MTGIPSPAAPRVVLTVPTWNGRHLLETFLPSVAAQRFRDFRVVVVDDASTDDTRAWLAATWPEVEAVALPVNGGVTRAFNACVRAAGDAELVGLFNNDIELDPDCLWELVAALDRHPEAGSAGAKLMNFHRRDELDGAGDRFDWAGTATRRGHGEVDRGLYEAEEAVFGACAGAAMYRRSAFERVGLFDERFHAFFEDVDWNLRAQLAGLPARYVPRAVAYHMGSATIGQGLTDFTRYRLIRNGIWIVVKDFPLPVLLRHAPRILYVQLAQVVTAAQAGQLRVWARAVRDALRALPAVLRDRRTVQRTRVVALAELERAVVPR